MIFFRVYLPTTEMQRDMFSRNTKTFVVSCSYFYWWVDNTCLLPSKKIFLDKKYLKIFYKFFPLPVESIPINKTEAQDHLENKSYLFSGITPVQIKSKRWADYHLKFLILLDPAKIYFIYIEIFKKKFLFPHKVFPHYTHLILEIWRLVENGCMFG